MTRYNRFGATYTDVMALYPGAALVDYDAGGANGQTKIEGALDRAVLRFAMALSPEVFRQMTKVEAEQPVRFAASGATTFVLGLGPMTAGSLHAWRYPSLYTVGSGQVDNVFTSRPVPGVYEEPGVSSNTVSAVTTVTFARALNIGERTFATYDVDVDSATFTMPSIAALCLYGAAAELGAFLYSEGTQEWKLVDEYRKRWEEALKAATEGSWVPDELRRLNYWEEVERSSNEVRSIPRPRG